MKIFISKIKLRQLSIWETIKEEIPILRIGLLPGIVIIGLVIITRLAGFMQSLEWLALDNFLYLRPEENLDEKIVIVGINEDDIRGLQDYSLSDKALAELLWKLQSHHPRVIGLDIYRDLSVNPGKTELITAFKNIKNLIAIEKVLPEKVAPPLELPSEQIGFADQIPDSDGKLRRSLLGTPTDTGYKLSLSLRLAQVYLAAQGISLENGIRDRAAMRFGKTELPRLSPNSRAYVQTDTGGIQMLVNFRHTVKGFRTLSWNDIKNNQFDPDWISDRIVIIGITASSRKDYITTSAVKTRKPATGRVYGVEIQAHVVSQIISAVLDSRPLLNTWDEQWEYIWIITWGFLGVASARLTKSPGINFFLVGIAMISLITISYSLLIWGWWVPVIPASIVLAVNGIALTALYQYDRALRAGIKARQVIIERTYETIHN